MNSRDNQSAKPGEYPPGCPVNSNTFPGKLWKLVNDERFQSIKWTNGGTTIGVDSHKFKFEVLARENMGIFKTKNFSSFVRQLNLYGFRKITGVQNSRIYDYSQNHIHSHPRQHTQSELQHFQHSCFDQNQPELLIRVRRASAAQKRKAQENAELNGGRYRHHFFPSSSGVLKDRTNLFNPGKPFPVSLIANKGKVFGLSLIASANEGSLIATPVTGQNFDFSKLCNQKGQLRKYVVIGRQDAHGAGLMFFDDTDLSCPPILKAYDMSPLGNPNSSVGHALTEAPLDTSISEAETAVSFLLNETFESSQSVSPDPPQLWEQLPLPLSPEPEPALTEDNLRSTSSSTGLSSSGSKDTSSGSDPSSSSTSRSSGSSFTSSSRPALYNTSSSFNSSRRNSSQGLSRSSGSFSSGLTSSRSSGPSMMMPSFGPSRSDSGMLLPPTMSTMSSTFSFMNPGKGGIISSAFMNATQEFIPQRRMSQESSLMEVHMPMMDDEPLAAPLPPSPVTFATGLMQAPTSTPVMNMGRPICTVPNCQCHLAPRPPQFPTSQPMPMFNMQTVVPMKLEPC